jgi:hypothetical protein
MNQSLLLEQGLNGTATSRWVDNKAGIHFNELILLPTKAPPSRPMRRGSFGCTTSLDNGHWCHGNKCVRFNDQMENVSQHSSSIGSDVDRMTDEECAAYWWTKDEILFFHERAYQSVHALNGCARTTDKGSTAIHGQSLWLKRTQVVRRAYDQASELAFNPMFLDMTQEYLYQREQFALSLALDWIGITHGSGIDVGDSLSTPRGLEKHYMIHLSEHYASLYRGRIIACSCSGTYSSLQLAKLSQHETRVTAEFARVMGLADQAAVSKSMKLSENPSAPSALKDAYDLSHISNLSMSDVFSYPAFPQCHQGGNLVTPRTA